MAKASKNSEVWLLDGHAVKGYPSASLSSEENRVLASLVVESSKLLDRGLAELEDVSSQISMLVEAARETSSLNQRRISTLQAVANSHGTDLRTLLQQCQFALEQGRAAGRSAPAEALQPAEAEELEVAPELFEPDQG